MFIAALCHDLDHMGYNNTFLMKTGAPLAALYHASVLENHHFSQMIAILQIDGHTPFSLLSAEEYKKARNYNS